MASADRIQIVISALDHTKAEITQTKRNMTMLQKEMTKLNDEIANGGVEAQKAYDEKRAAWDAERRKLADLDDAYGKAKTQARELGIQGKRSAKDMENAFSRATNTIRKKMSGLGSKLGSALKTGIRTIGYAAGGAIAGVIGYTLAKGFQRLSAIEKANTTMKSLGMTAKQTAAVMESATRAVKGTAFGLDEAATLASSLSVSGIKAGKDLEAAVTLAADAATAANVPLADMGSIFATVAATGKLQGDTMNQLQGQGIPVLQLLAKHYGITGEEAQKMVSDGKVSFQDFSKVMKKSLGGAAKESGKTFDGALKNLGAALGRIGEALLGPGFKSLPKIMGKITDKIDELQPVAKKVGKTLKHWFKDNMPGIKKAFGTFFDILKTVVNFFKRNPDALKALAVALGAVTVAVWALNVALYANPVVWIALAIGVLIAALAYLYFKFEDVRTVVNTVFKAIVWYFRLVLKATIFVWSRIFKAIGAVVRWLVNTAWPAIKKFASAIADAFRRMWRNAKTAWRQVTDAITTAKNRIGEIIAKIKESIKGIWDGITGGLREKIDQAKQFLKDLFPGLSALPWFFAGGPVPAGTRALVGEIGPEMFIPNAGQPQMIGEHGAEVRNFSTSGVIIPNHLLAHVAAPQQRSGTATASGPSVSIGEIHVADRFDVEAAMTNAMLRAARIDRERR